jgi:hypothetical protein
MSHKIIVAGIVAGYFALLGSATNALGAEKPRKPTVCVSFQEVTTARGKVALCLDGKSAKVLVRYTIVTMDGARFAVGYSKVGE